MGMSWRPGPSPTPWPPSRLPRWRSKPTGVAVMTALHDVTRFVGFGGVAVGVSWVVLYCVRGEPWCREQFRGHLRWRDECCWQYRRLSATKAPYHRDHEQTDMGNA